MLVFAFVGLAELPDKPRKSFVSSVLSPHNIGAKGGLMAI
jgi:hypothetical protein